MINPMKLMKIKNAWSRFAANHPKFPLFLIATLIVMLAGGNHF